MLFRLGYIVGIVVVIRCVWLSVDRPSYGTATEEHAVLGQSAGLVRENIGNLA